MKIKKNVNSKAHNWLIHHYGISAVEENLIYFSGNVLDIGCGKKPYESIIRRNVNSYIGLESNLSLHDFEQVDVIGNALMLPFPDNHFNCAVSFQVLEHVSEPITMFLEAYRIIKPGGYFVLSTPFLWGEHEQPYDYYRFTQFGLSYLADKVGFRKIMIEGQTGFWGASILRFNYWLQRFSKSFLKYLINPIFFIDQHFARLMDIFDKKMGYRVDTATYFAVFRKPLVEQD